MWIDHYSNSCPIVCVPVQTSFQVGTETSLRRTRCWFLPIQVSDVLPVRQDQDSSVSAIKSTTSQRKTPTATPLGIYDWRDFLRISHIGNRFAGRFGDLDGLLSRGYEWLNPFRRRIGCRYRRGSESERFTCRVALKKRTASSFGVDVSGREVSVCVGVLHKNRSAFNDADVLAEFEMHPYEEIGCWKPLTNSRILFQSSAVQETIEPPSHIWFGADDFSLFGNIENTHAELVRKPTIESVFGLPKHNPRRKNKDRPWERIPCGLILARFEPGADPPNAEEENFWLKHFPSALGSTCARGQKEPTPYKVMVSHCADARVDDVLGCPVAYNQQTVHVPRVDAGCCIDCQTYCKSVPDKHADARAVLLETWACEIRCRLHPPLHPQTPRVLDSVFAQKIDKENPNFDSTHLQKRVLDYVATPRVLILPKTQQTKQVLTPDVNVKTLLDHADLWGAEVMEALPRTSQDTVSPFNGDTASWRWQFDHVARFPDAVVVTNLGVCHSYLCEPRFDDYIAKGGLVIVFPGEWSEFQRCPSPTPCRVCTGNFIVLPSMLPKIFPFLVGRPGWDQISWCLNKIHHGPYVADGWSSREEFSGHGFETPESPPSFAAVLSEAVLPEDRLFDVGIGEEGSQDETDPRRPYATIARHGRGHLVYIGDHGSITPQSGARIVKCVIAALGARRRFD